IVRRDRQKLLFELLALADVHRENLVRQAGLFEEDRDLVAVGRRPVMQVDHGERSIFLWFRLRCAWNSRFSTPFPRSLNLHAKHDSPSRALMLIHEPAMTAKI